MQQSAVVSFVGTIAVLVSYLRSRPAFPPRVDDATSRKQFLHTARSVTATTWPLVLSLFNKRPTVTTGCVVPSVVWMFVIWWLDVRHLDEHSSTKDLSKFLQRGVRMEPSILTALTFGMCGLAGARSDTPYTKYIVYALVACAMVVLPHVELLPEDPMTPVISEIQRAVLVHGIATVVTCVCLTRTSTTPMHA